MAAPLRGDFGSRVCDELLAVELFSCLTEAQALIEDSRIDYNHHRPHSSLQMMTPGAFAATVGQPLSGPTATAAGEGVEEPCRLPLANGEPTVSVILTGRQQSPTEDARPSGLAGQQPQQLTGQSVWARPPPRGPWQLALVRGLTVYSPVPAVVRCRELTGFLWAAATHQPFVLESATDQPPVLEAATV